MRASQCLPMVPFADCLVGLRVLLIAKASKTHTYLSMGICRTGKRAGADARQSGPEAAASSPGRSQPQGAQADCCWARQGLLSHSSPSCRTPLVASRDSCRGSAEILRCLSLRSSHMLCKQNSGMVCYCLHLPAGRGLSRGERFLISSVYSLSNLILTTTAFHLV